MVRISHLRLGDGEGVILGSLRQVGSEVNRYREIAPHVRYKYPPPQQRMLHGQQVPRLEGTTLTGEALRDGVQGSEPIKGAAPRLWQALAGQGLGISPLLAREGGCRALGATGAVGAAGAQGHGGALA